MDKLALLYHREERGISLALRFWRNSCTLTDFNTSHVPISFAHKAINCCLMINYRQSGQLRIIFTGWETWLQSCNSINTVRNILTCSQKVPKTSHGESEPWWLLQKLMESRMSLRSILCERKWFLSFYIKYTVSTKAAPFPMCRKFPYLIMFFMWRYI